MQEAEVACGDGEFTLESGSHMLCFHVRCTPVQKNKKDPPMFNPVRNGGGIPLCESGDSYFGEDPVMSAMDSVCWMDEVQQNPNEWVNTMHGSSARRDMLVFEEGSEMQLWSVPHQDNTDRSENLAGWESTGAEDGDPVVFTLKIVSFVRANSKTHGIMWCTA